MKQQITNIILEMIGEDKTNNGSIYGYEKGYNKALQGIRDKAPEIADRIDNEIYKPVEYNTAQKYVLKTALENLGEMDDEQYEFIRNNLLNRFK
jgi:hypothetical protein